jgi:RHS repeat-associated protein
MVCQKQNGVIYSVAPITNATSYIWTLPAGATIVAGKNTNSITVNYSATASSGNISVQGTNACSSGPASANYAVLVNIVPSAAGTITGTATVNQGQNGVIYSVPAIANATSYTWILPSGAIIASGDSTNSITVNYLANASSGNLTVLGTNSCGSGPASANYKVTVSSLPDPAGTITGTATVNQGQSGVNYNVPVIANATGYIWTLPAGATIASGDSTNSITVNYSANAASGNITVQGTNTYGAGAVSANFAITVNGQILTDKCADMNYVQTRTILKDNVFTEDAVETLSADEMQKTIAYFDGLGRPRQTVSWQASPAYKDIVAPVVYDDFGREEKKYLPYAGINNDGAFVCNDTIEQKAFYSGMYGVADGTTAFAKTDFEASPLNRVFRQGAPGAAWQPNADAANDHSVKLAYDTNTDSEVKRWTVVNDVLTDSGYYAAATLYKMITWDENNDQTSGSASHTEEFKDLQGKVVLKVATDGANKLYTYYVYDDFDLLRFVLPPKAIENNNLVLNKLDSLGYHYRYDSRNRMIQKKVANSWGWTYMVYDQRDRLVATQDMVMRTFNPANGRWLITKYDQLNRPVMTASKALSDSRETLQAYLDSYSATSAYYETRDGSNVGYTMGDSFGTKLSLSESDLLSVTYYDTYDYPGVKSFDNSVRVSDYSDGDATPYYFDRIKGQATGSRAKVLDGTENNASGYRWLVSTSYYDDYYRAIQTLQDLFTTDATYYEAASTRYDFVGKVMQTKQAQTVNNVTTTIDKYLTYDHAGRLTKTEQQIAGDATNGKVTVSENSYNEIGQLIDKKLHKTPLYNYLQSIDYTYNIRGWLTAINDPDHLSTLQPGDPNLDLFGEKLLYNTSEAALNSGYAKQFNGNIAAMVWKTTDKAKQGYAFTYDGLNRLTSSDHKSSATTAWVDDNNYEEKSLTYDNNGNIKHLVRTDGLGNIAEYKYAIVGNALRNINDGGYYNYDANMNTTFDGLRGVSIAYNILNLPKLVSKETDIIAYIYSAAGEKLAKRMKDGIYQYYAGNMVYKNDKSLNYLSFEEGLVNKVSGGYAYEYHLKDHLGNTRVTFQPNGSSTTTTQVADYYPFGSSYLPISPAGTNKYLYNGKEKQDDVLGNTALDWYDYGARFYDPQIGRWHTIDPMAEKHFNINPYHYVFNNPIKYIDFGGFDADTIHVQEVTCYGKDGSNKNKNNNTVSWWWEMQGNYNPYKVRDADAYENWLIRNIDQSLVRLMGEAFGDYAASPTLNNHVRSNDYFGKGKETTDEEIMDEYGGTQETTPDSQGKPVYKQTVDEKNLHQYEGTDGTVISVYPNHDPASGANMVDSLISNPNAPNDTLYRNDQGSHPSGMKYSKSYFPFVNGKHGDKHGWDCPPHK